MDSTPRLPRLVPHLSGDKLEVRGGWISFLAVGEQTGGAYTVIETATLTQRPHFDPALDLTWVSHESDGRLACEQRALSARDRARLPDDHINTHWDR